MNEQDDPVDPGKRVAALRTIAAIPAEKFAELVQTIMQREYAPEDPATYGDGGWYEL